MIDLDALSNLMQAFQDPNGPKIKFRIEFDTETMMGTAYIWDGQQLSEGVDLMPSPSE